MHVPVDRVKDKNFFYMMDSRLKIIALILFIFFCSGISSVYLLAFAAAFIVVLNIFLGKGFAALLKRLIISLPFAAVIIFIPFTTPGKFIGTGVPLVGGLGITLEGIILFLKVFLKFFISVSSLLLLMSTTSFKRLLSGFRGLRVPWVFIILIEFILRYYSVFKGELDRMATARKARSVKQRTGFRELADACRIVGYALIRALNRSTRIYNSMVSRGYDGESIPVGHESPGVIDYIITVTFIAAGLLLVVMDRSGFIWSLR